MLPDDGSPRTIHRPRDLGIHNATFTEPHPSDFADWKGVPAVARRFNAA